MNIHSKDNENLFVLYNPLTNNEIINTYPTVKSTLQKSFFLFFLHKAGSTLLSSLFYEYCEKINISLVDFPSIAFLSGEDISNMKISSKELLFKEINYGYIGWREFWDEIPVDILTKSNNILLVRDPRDRIVSWYFSMAYSHTTPKQGPIIEGIKEIRNQILKYSNINEWIKSNPEVIELMNEPLIKYNKRLYANNTRIYRYEDVIFKKEDWLRDMLFYLGIEINEEILKVVVDANDKLPANENQKSHIRQVNPGNYKKHLSPEIISYLNDEFKDQIRQYNYDDEASFGKDIVFLKENNESNNLYISIQNNMEKKHSQNQISPNNSFSNFDFYAYAKKTHISNLKKYAMELYVSELTPETTELKQYQDLIIYAFIKENIPEGSSILDIGGGDSRICKKLANKYDCWNIDPLNGDGNGLKSINHDGYKLVQDYIGNFNKELPNDYFDFVFSISVMEHIPENNPNFQKNIIQDINRVLKVGAYSLHLLDCIIKPDSFWKNSILDKMLDLKECKMKAIPFDEIECDPDLFTLHEDVYNKHWLPTTKISFSEFGKPTSVNVIWRKGERNLEHFSQKMQKKEAHLQKSIAFIHNWPGTKNSELDLIQRITTIVEKYNYKCFNISPWGQILSEDGSHFETCNVGSLDFDIILYFHYTSPKLLDSFSYLFNWNPVQYILKSPIDGSDLGPDHISFLSTCFQSHDVIISAGSKKIDNLVNSFNSFSGINNIEPNLSFHTTCQIKPDIDFPSLEKFKVFYISANWERQLNINRHGSLLELMDETNEFNFYGLKKQNGVYLWSGIKNYKGELAFDGGNSIIVEANKCGVTLVLHSQPHRESEVVSTRIFQACASKTVIITDDNPWIVENFGDSVLSFEYRHLDNEWNIIKIKEKIEWIKRNPEKAIAKAKKSHQIFSDKFSLDYEVKQLIANHNQAVNNFENNTCSKKDTSIVKIIYIFDSKNVDDLIEDVSKQKKVKICLSVYYRNEDETELRKIFNALPSGMSFELIHFSKTQPILIGQAVCNAIQKNETFDALIIYSTKQRWMKYHLSMLLRSIEDGNLIAQSGFFIKPNYFDTVKTNDYFSMSMKALNESPKAITLNDLENFRSYKFLSSSFMFSSKLFDKKELFRPLEFVDYGSFFFILSINYAFNEKLPALNSKISCFYKKETDGYSFDPYKQSLTTATGEKSFFYSVFKNTKIYVFSSIDYNQFSSPISQTLNSIKQQNDDQSIAQQKNDIHSLNGQKSHILNQKIADFINEKKIFITIKNSGEFDKKWYLQYYKDVKLAGVEPIMHYIRHGWREGRNPSQTFDTSDYLWRRPDVKEKGICPLYHYILTKKEK